LPLLFFLFSTSSSYSQLQGFLSETLARINESLATELMMVGYKTEMIPLVGAAYVAAVRVPEINMEFYCLGAVNRWYIVWVKAVKQDT
jgi:hypothetical protein